MNPLGGAAARYDDRSESVGRRYFRAGEAKLERVEAHA